MASGKAETGRLGNENSEDAVTWNVFRALQEGGCLRVASDLLVGATATAEPELYLWGRRIGTTDTDTWTELHAIRDELEPGKRQQTEPDACLHIAGWGWVFIEAKFGSRTDVYGDQARVKEWIGRYSAACPGVFNDDAIGSTKLSEFPQQLLRNIAFAHKLKAEGENAVVVALVRDRDTTDVERWVERCLAETAGVGFRRATWEELYRGLTGDDTRLERLRLYMENKSYMLPQAFAI